MNFTLANIYGPVGLLQMARLYKVSDSSTVSDLALTEGDPQTFGGTVALSPTPEDGEYEYEVRQVLTQDGGGFTASTTITVSRGTFGYASNGVWLDAVGGPIYGDWWSWDGIQNILGADNSAVVSQLDNAIASADLVRVAADGALAEVYAERRMRLAGFDDTDALLTSLDAPLITYATNMYAAYLLARHREWFEATSDAGKKWLVDLKGQAMEMFDMLFGLDPTGVDGTLDSDDQQGGGEFAFVPIDRGTPDDADEFAA